MDPFFTPIKSVRPSGLTVITLRTDRKGIMAGEISVGVGAAHATKIKQRWMGLPHFAEHMIAVGASRHYGQDEAKKLLQEKFFVPFNAYTTTFETRHFTTGAEGYVLPSRNFWPAFAITADGLFYPQFDLPTLEREMGRILEEISQNLTPARRDERKFHKLIYGVDYMEFETLGTPEQVSGYTRDDFVEFHRSLYDMGNTRVVVTGDVDHAEAVERIEEILKDVPPAQSNLPSLEKSELRTGEFRRHREDSNPGHAEIYLNFPAVDQTSDLFYATNMAVVALNSIVDEKLKNKYELYTANMAYSGWTGQGVPLLTLILITGKKEKAIPSLEHALEIIQSPETHAEIARRYDDLVAQKINDAETAQSKIETLANLLNDIDGIGAPLLSPEQKLERYRATTADQVVGIARDLSHSQMFLNLRGHPDSLDVLPPIDVIDAWRSKPTRGEPRTPEPRSVLDNSQK